MIIRSIQRSVLSVLLLLALIAPAAAVGPDKKLTWPGGGRGKVTFDGDDHSDENYACTDCHPGLFAMKFGAAKMTMDAMRKGQYCGACHNGVRAFSTTDPDRCEQCHRKSRQDRRKRSGGF